MTPAEPGACDHGYVNWWECPHYCKPTAREAERTDESKALLDRLAAALDACQEAGLKPRLRHGAVYTRAGYVLPPIKGGRWVARTLADDGSAPDGDGDDE